MLIRKIVSHLWPTFSNSSCFERAKHNWGWIKSSFNIRKSFYKLWQKMATIILKRIYPDTLRLKNDKLSLIRGRRCQKWVMVFSHHCPTLATLLNIVINFGQHCVTRSWYIHYHMKMLELKDETNTIERRIEIYCGNGLFAMCTIMASKLHILMGW